MPRINYLREVSLSTVNTHKEERTELKKAKKDSERLDKYCKEHANLNPPSFDEFIGTIETCIDDLHRYEKEIAKIKYILLPQNRVSPRASLDTTLFIVRKRLDRLEKLERTLDRLGLKL